jgi:hypothetical protein
MNQSRNHWLLLDALTIAINLIVIMESKAYPLDGNETFDLFDVELHTLDKNMQQEL